MNGSLFCAWYETQEVLHRTPQSIDNLDQAVGATGRYGTSVFARRLAAVAAHLEWPIVLLTPAAVLALQRLADRDLFAIHLHLDARDAVCIRFLSHGRETENAEVVEIHA